MNFLKAFAIVAIAGGIVACSDENASAVWNSAELSSSTVIPDSKVSEPAEVPGSSSGVVIPDSVPGTPSSSSTENVAQSSSSETVADTVWHQANLTWYTSWPIRQISRGTRHGRNRIVKNALSTMAAPGRVTLLALKIK